MVTFLPLREHGASDFDLAGQTRFECQSLWRSWVVDDASLSYNVLHSPALRREIIVGVVRQDDDGQTAANGTKMHGEFRTCVTHSASGVKMFV